jgi:hypothetical protein
VREHKRSSDNPKNQKPNIDKSIIIFCSKQFPDIHNNNFKILLCNNQL